MHQASYDNYLDNSRSATPSLLFKPEVIATPKGTYNPAQSRFTQSDQSKMISNSDLTALNLTPLGPADTSKNVSKVINHNAKSVVTNSSKSKKMLKIKLK